METSTKFSGTELIFTVTNCIISKLFLTYPSSFSALGSSGSIMLAFFTVVAGFVLMGVTVYLYGNKREDITKLIKNHALRTATTFLIVLMLVINLSFLIRSVSESLKISILPSSPSLFISFIFVSGALICSHTGLKSIIRSHSFIVPFTIVMAIILVVSSVRNIEFYNLFPIFGNGWKMVPYVWMLCAYFADFLVLLLLIPYASENTSYKKITAGCLILSSVMLVVIISLYTLVIPYNTSDNFFIPVYKVAQYINYENFMSRLEPVFTVGWLLSFFAYAALFLYLASMLTGRILKTKSNRPIMYVISIVSLGLSLIPKNTVQLSEWFNWFSVPRLIVGIVLPIAILLFCKRRKAVEK